MFKKLEREAEILAACVGRQGSKFRTLSAGPSF